MIPEVTQLKNFRPHHFIQGSIGNNMIPVIGKEKQPSLRVVKRVEPNIEVSAGSLAPSGPLSGRFEKRFVHRGRNEMNYVEELLRFPASDDEEIDSARQRGGPLSNLSCKGYRFGY